MSTFQQVLNRAIYYLGDEELLADKDSLIPVTSWDTSVMRTKANIAYLEKNGIRWIILEDKRSYKNREVTYYALFRESVKECV